MSQKGTQIDTPDCVLAAARSLTGWALGTHKALQGPNGKIAVTIHLAHRGGFFVPHAPFRHARGYDVTRVHSFNSGQTATVWLTLRPVDL